MVAGVVVDVGAAAVDGRTLRCCNVGEAFDTVTGFEATRRPLFGFTKMVLLSGPGRKKTHYLMTTCSL